MSKADDVEVAIEAQARAWLLRLRSGNVTPDDMQAFRQWCAEHPEMAHMLRDTWSTLRSAAADIAQEEAASGGAWTGPTGGAHPLRPGRRAFVGFAIAAGASWLALRPPLQLWPALGEFAADYRTGTGEQKQVALTGRVVVEMNTQTRINILPMQTGQVAQHGIDVLAGEAEIMAAAPAIGRSESVNPVVVVAGCGRLQAQIARFDVRRAGNQVCVTCISGSLAFEHPRQRLTLSAAQQLVYDDRNVQRVSQVDPSTVVAWRRGVVVFNDVPLAQVIDEINRYRPGKVILRNAELGGNRVQAQFPIARLDDMVDMLGKVYGARVTRLPGEIVLLS
jgi:transmembrane sensor